MARTKYLNINQVAFLL